MSNPATKFPKSQRQHTGDYRQDYQQRARDQIAGVLNNAPFLRGLSTGAVSIGIGGSVKVDHKLGRQPVGFFITDITTGPAAVYRTAWDATSITFANGGAASTTVTMWVF